MHRSHMEGGNSEFNRQLDFIIQQLNKNDVTIEPDDATQDDEDDDEVLYLVYVLSLGKIKLVCC